MVSGGKMTLTGFKRILFDVSDVITEMERSLKDDVDRTILDNAIDMLKDEEEQDGTGCGNIMEKCTIF